MRDSLINLPGTGFSQAKTTFDLSLVVNTQYFLSGLTMPVPLATKDVLRLAEDLPLLPDLEFDLLPELFLIVYLREADCPERA